jgi:hypothetical protein
MDRLLSIACVHEMHMEALWGVYEEVVNEYYAWKPREVNFDLDEYPDNSKDA